jgi:translation elongation factor EF-1alpha
MKIIIIIIKPMILLFRGPTFIDYLDSLPSFNRSIDGPLRMPIIERYKVD